jgi:D-beta-D-heptose 7-phosphate kinase/D-beta-D-heptose 1-phosphate adenosyltransferase
LPHLLYINRELLLFRKHKRDLGKLDFSRAKIAIIGDVMLDIYWHGVTSRMSPEAAVPIVNVERFEHRGGGAANVALNIAHLGGFANLLSLVGDDIEATYLENCLKKDRIKQQLIREVGNKTITKLRVLSGHQHMLRIDFENNFLTVADNIFPLAYRLLDEAALVVFSDYAKGTLKNIQPMIAYANTRDIPSVVDPKSKDFTIYRGATIVTPNLAEFEAVAGYSADDDILISKAQAICHDCDFKALLITRGEQGMVLTGPNIPTLNLPAQKVDVVDITGAGDTVVATLACALATGYRLIDAVNLANIAASLVVEKSGTATVTLSELQDALGCYAVDKITE